MRRALWLLGAGLVVSACDVTAARVEVPDSVLQELRDKERRLAESPEDLELKLRIATMYAEGGHPFAAADHYLGATEIAPSDPRPRVGLARAYRKLGLFTRAFLELRDCLGHDPGAADCLYESGSMLKADGSPEGLSQAQVAWERFLSTAPAGDPRREEVAKGLKQLEAQLGPQRGPASRPASAPSGGGTGAAPAAGAGEEPARAAAIMPEHRGTEGADVGELNPFGQAIARALDAVRRRDAPAAEAAFREALALRPEDPGALAGLAETLHHAQKTDEAIEKIEKAWSIDPTHGQVRWVYGLVMIKAGRNMREAVEAWKALERDDPDYAARLGVTRTLEAVRKFEAEREKATK